MKDEKYIKQLEQEVERLQNKLGKAEQLLQTFYFASSSDTFHHNRSELCSISSDISCVVWNIIKSIENYFSTDEDGAYIYAMRGNRPIYGIAFTMISNNELMVSHTDIDSGQDLSLNIPEEHNLKVFTTSPTISVPNIIDYVKTIKEHYEQPRLY